MTLDDLDPYFVALDDYTELIAEYVAAKAAREQADAEVTRVREMLLKLLPETAEAPDGVIGTVAGVARLSYRPYARRQLDQRKLREHYPSVSAECSAYVPQWTLRTITVTEA